jgi:outer membrane protein assembly factor BamE
MDIRQGNYICEETVSRLRVGMTKAQIQELFGSPAITHVLNKDRWDYYYSFEPGTDRGADNIERRISIYFRNDIVVRWE